MECVERFAKARMEGVGFLCSSGVLFTIYSAGKHTLSSVQEKKKDCKAVVDLLKECRAPSKKAKQELERRTVANGRQSTRTPLRQVDSRTTPPSLKTLLGVILL